MAQRNIKGRSQPDVAFRLGIVSDTHQPDRVRSLHPRLLPELREAGVQHILHAGDICAPSVIRQLEEIAPVTAVRGNRDWAFFYLPTVWQGSFAGVSVALMHGHGNLARYLIDKVHYLRQGYRLDRYIRPLVEAAPQAQVLIFGHTHFPEILSVDQRLIINPGSASFGVRRQHPCCVVLDIWTDQSLHPRKIWLKGYKLNRQHEWEGVSG